MTTTTRTASYLTHDDPQFGKRLLKAATTPREKAAVWALVEEGEILTINAVRKNLVCETGKGMKFTWEHLACALYGLGLDPSGRAFLDLVLSLSGPHQTSLTRVTELDTRRLGIVLHAMARLADNDTIVIDTKL